MARVSFRVAPGVRISASSRGVRTSIGNSNGRVSFGSGGTYTSAKIAGVRVQNWSGTGGAPRATLAGLNRAEKDAAVGDLARIEQSLVTLHHHSFASAREEQVSPPIPADVDRIRLKLEKSLLSKISFFKFRQRRAAKEQARHAAAEEAVRLEAVSANQYQLQRTQAAEQWRQLSAHDPETVIAALEGAFADNASEATCVDAGVQDGVRYATVVIVFGAADLIPDRTPWLTPAGNLTTKKRSKTERNALFVAALGSTVLATVKEGFAVAPSVDEFRVIVLRKDLAAARPMDYVAPIYVAQFGRKAVAELRWSTVEPVGALLSADGAMLSRKGAVGDVLALDLSEDQETAGLVDAFRPLVLGQ